MAGTGNRFVQKGYQDPKPLIEVNNKRIIEYILDMFSENDEFVFICNETHLKETNMRETLHGLTPHAQIVSMPQHKLGPVYTVKSAYEFIEDEEPVLISYCDNPFLWNYRDFLSFVEDENLDGCVLTHTGFHPHTLSTTKMAYLRESDGLLKEIKEKESYTEDPMSEHASTGAYYFKRGGDLKKYFDLAIEKDLSYNGEYYVTLVYNLLAKDDLRVGYYDAPYITVFGTPAEVENFEAWCTILEGAQIKDEADLIKTYRYWKEYHEKSNICRY
jgi:NDP-sugar pyrophosphorylase family protein